MTKGKVFQVSDVRTSKYCNAISPLSKGAYEALKQSIKNKPGGPRLYIPISINESGDVLDGHHRLQACQDLGIEATFEEKHFNSELEEQLYVYEINRARRHLSEFQRIELVLKEKPLLAELAKRNMSSGGKIKKLKGSQIQETFHTDKELAKRADSTKDKVYKAEQVIKTALETPNARLETDYDGRYRGRSGPTISDLLTDVREENLTIPKAYNILKHNTIIKTKRAEAEFAARELNLPSKVVLLNKDSTKLEELTTEELKDNSIDLIVTDPPYLRDSLDSFKGLARLANSKLKPGGSLVFYFGQYQLFDVGKIFAEYAPNLEYWWMFTVLHEGAQTTRMHVKGVRVQWKPMLWYVKGSKRLAYNDVFDLIKSTKPDKTTHPWAQSSTEAEYLIKNLTISEDSLVVDPFLGSGAFAIPAIKLKRWFIGIELDKDVFENAKNNIIISTNNNKA